MLVDNSTDRSAPPYAEAVLHHIRAQRSAFVDYLTALVEHESPSTDPAAQQPVFDQLAASLDALGFWTQRVPGERTGGQLYARPARRERDQPFQLLIGHGDTVWPHGTLDQMPACVDGNRLRGPGVFDMKAGLAMIVFALETLRALDLTPALTPVVLVNSDEEIGSFESKPVIDRLARSAARAFVLEPALGLDGKIKTARKGTGEFEIIVQGQAANAGGSPDDGASAIVELSHVVQALHAMNDPERGISVNVGTIDGGRQPSVVAPTSRATVDVRVPTRDDARAIATQIKTLEPITPGVELTVHGGIERMPMERTPRNQALWALAQQLGRSIGLTLNDGLSGGASDGNFTSRYTATLDGLGAVGDGAHADHEFIAIDDTLERCALLALLLMAPPLP
jgi:glutamate carboxypeptidase